MDGYVGAEAIKSLSEIDPEGLKKYVYMQELYDNQIRIDKEIAILSSEIESLPKMPSNMDRWISSFRSDFKIPDLIKSFKINKKYRSLIEERRSNGRKIKIFAIENIIDQISEVVDKPITINEEKEI